MIRQETLHMDSPETIVLAIWPLDAIGPWEWVILAVAAVLLFGKRLPEFGRWIGRSVVEFKKGVQGMQEEIAKSGQEGEAPEPSAEEKKDGGGQAPPLSKL
jgi:TatA/E family protein of Tat protein translocase